MAGLYALPYFLQYQREAEQQRMQQQEAAMRLATFQQQQLDRQRQQAALAAAGNALPMLLAGQQGAPQQAPQMPAFPAAANPQTPNPGQPSQPMQQSGGVPGIPPLSTLPPIPAKMPTGAEASTGKPGIPPFRPLPTAASSPAQADAGAPQIPASPAPSAAENPGSPSGPLSFESAIKVLKDQGLSGADLMAGLQQLTPILDSQAKMQAASLNQQFTHQLQLAQLQERYDALRQRSEDNALNRDARMQAHQDSLMIQRKILAMKLESLNSRLQGDPNAALQPEDLKFMAQQYLAGDRTVMQNLGRGMQGSKNIVALRNEVRKQAEAQGMSGKDVAAAVAEFEGVKSGERALGTRTAQAGMAVNEADQFADIALSASQKVPRSQFVPANRALNAYRTNTGDPTIVQLGAATNSLINAYARAVSPSGTPTVSDKEHAREMLNTAQTPEQYAAVISMMKREMAAAQQSPGQVRSEFREAVTRGKPMANPAPAPGGLPAGWSVTEH